MGISGWFTDRLNTRVKARENKSFCKIQVGFISGRSYFLFFPFPCLPISQRANGCFNVLMAARLWWSGEILLSL